MEALDSKEVADWVAASNAVTDPYLRSLPLRNHFTTRLTELWNYPRVGLPVVEAGTLFYARNAGLQRQAPVYRRASMSAAPTLVMDPNEISADGSVSLGQWTPSPDAKLLAYGLAEGGADWRTVRVRDVASGRTLTAFRRTCPPSGIACERCRGTGWSTVSVRRSRHQQCSNPRWNRPGNRTRRNGCIPRSGSAARRNRS